MKAIRHEEYMKNASELHHDFYAQFATDKTFEYVRSNVGIDLLNTSKDKHLNDIGIHHSNGGAGYWVWDFAPIDLELARKLGATGKRSIPSPKTITCIAKAAARILINKDWE